MNTKRKLVYIPLLILFFSLSNATNDDFYIDNQTIQKVEEKYGEFAKNRVLALISLMNSLKSAEEIQKIIQVNNFFNQVPYMSDEENWGVKDYWATRLEFLGKDRGDCEDYATAKYFTLQQLGIDTKKMYLTYVKATKQKVSHMVLTYFKSPTSIPLVLDNYDTRILPANQRQDLIPVYSFNGDSLFIAKQQGLGEEVPSGNTKNKKWLQLLQDIRRNKL